MLQGLLKLLQKFVMNTEFMNNNSYIKKTGQMWKILLSFCLLTVGFLFLIWTLINSHLTDAHKMYGIFLGLSLSIGSFLWLCFSVKCKNCKSLLVWKAMREQSHQNWLIFLLKTKNCPYCHNEAERER